MKTSTWRKNLSSNFQVASKTEIYRTIVGQKLYPVIVDGLAQLDQGVRVKTGQLKKDRLTAVGGVLLFGNRLVVPKHHQSEVIEIVHSQHHIGQAATLRSQLRNFFWLNMAREVKSFVVDVQYNKEENTKLEHGSLCAKWILGRKFPVKQAMDIGTLPWTNDECSGYRYFLLMVELSTRYVEILRLKDQEMCTLLNAFVQRWVYRDFGQKTGIDKRGITAYHPQCDCMMERNIGLVKQVTRKLSDPEALLSQDLEGSNSHLEEVEQLLSLSPRSVGNILIPNQLVIGFYVSDQETVDMDLRFELLTKCWTPPAIVFPSHYSGRSEKRTDNSKIVTEVQKCGSFSILADESAHVSAHEQLSISVRYTTRNESSSMLMESLLRFVTVFDLTGEGIANSIERFCLSVGLDLNNLVGIGLDAASAMAGKFKGIQACILKSIQWPAIPIVLLTV
ncbi:52 kDa repressor of the inhibitor of the protein kinase-like [Oopsacas minuta]|uniref:52 kDa repressor of the inhibitor of the protein kinase-like n=1 Tax=Oopsacas minuta TaxID=111878 RepID=A0AAV7JYC4_9METZ|nr:52 kDa repressor of the inhibitor of the protein kinase-like [Oopsacas minuta]